mmetsp:Transcript_1079/g.2987  ORF Transcript_1079/g.2987 Transcript_1079/m.2987 type:complete len:434 (+) Transcript_1079:1141-2442(+)
MFQRPARPGRVRRLHVSHVVHDLVLALAGLVGAREDDGRRVGPAVERVRGALVREPRAERGAQRVHELRARRDAVGIKRVRVVGHGLARGDQLRVELLALLRGPEAPRPLLVHLRARRDAVDREVDGLRGPDDLADFVRKRKDAHELLALARDDEFRVVAVRAHVDDAVHVQVQVVDVRAALGGQAVAHALHDARVLVRQPPEHLRNAVERRDARRRRAAARRVHEVREEAPHLEHIRVERAPVVARERRRQVGDVGATQKHREGFPVQHVREGRPVRRRENRRHAARSNSLAEPRRPGRVALDHQTELGLVHGGGVLLAVHDFSYEKSRVRAERFVLRVLPPVGRVAHAQRSSQIVLRRPDAALGVHGQISARRVARALRGGRGGPRVAPLPPERRRWQRDVALGVEAPDPRRRGARRRGAPGVRGAAVFPK